VAVSRSPRGIGPGAALSVDFTSCDAHGLCAELLPELIELDEWGYPMILDTVPAELLPEARRAVAACPVMALRLVAATPAPAPQAAPARPERTRNS
jgi:ferredoxin